MALKFAKFISIILGPQFWLPLIVFITLLKSGLTSEQLNILLPIYILFLAIAPLAYLYLASHFGKVSSWDLPKKQERYTFLLVVMVSYLIALGFGYFLGNKLLLNLTLIFNLVLVFIAATTFFWKISIHAAINTTGALLLNYLFNWQLPWLYLSIPLVSWARIKLQRHTPLQVLAGTISSTIIVLSGIRFLIQ